MLRITRFFPPSELLSAVIFFNYGMVLFIEILKIIGKEMEGKERKGNEDEPFELFYLLVWLLL
jgi:hypothetical protein